MTNKKTKIRPLQDRVVIERLEGEEKTASGLFIPGTAQEKPQRGCVLAVGPDVTIDNSTTHVVGIKVGDVVLFAKYSGTEIIEDGSERIIIREDDIQAVVDTDVDTEGE